MSVEEIHIHSSRKKPLQSDGLTFRSANDYDLTEGDLEKAREELKESEETRVDCLKQLRDMLEGDKEFYFRKDNNYLLRFLRHSKFDCKRAYSRIRKFYSLRMNHPELFELPSNVEYMFNTNFFRYLPYRDEDGSIICLVDYRKWNLDEMSLSESFSLFNSTADILTMSPHCQIHGVTIILDLRGMTARHVWHHMNPKNLFLELSIGQSIHAFRIKHVVGISCNDLFRKCYRSMKYLIKKKITDRVVLLGSDMTELHQYVNPAVLPKDYGGSLDDEDCSITELMMENLPYLKYERTFGPVSKNQKD